MTGWYLSFGLQYVDHVMSWMSHLLYEFLQCLHESDTMVPSNSSLIIISSILPDPLYLLIQHCVVLTRDGKRYKPLTAMYLSLQ
jgi:hypothetical protein